MTSDARGKHRWILFLLCAMLVGIGLLLLAHAMWLQSIERKVETLQSDWRGRGLPATPAALEEWTSHPVDGVNAADLYDEAYAALVKPGDGFEAWYRFRQDYRSADEEALRETREYLAENARTLQLLRQATMNPAYARTVKIDELNVVSIDAVQNALTCCRLLSDDAKRALLDGDISDFEKDVKAMLRLGRALGTEPALISHLVAIACESIAVAEIEQALGHVDAPRDVAMSLAESLGEADDQYERMAKAFVGEVCILGNLFGDRFEEYLSFVAPLGLESDGAQRAIVTLYSLSGLRDLDRMHFLDLQTALHHAHLVPPGEIRAELEAIQHKTDNTSPLLLVTRSAADGVPGASLRALKNQASVRTARIGLLAHVYGLDHGEPPAALHQLVPDYIADLPRDPFTNTNLVYRAEERSFIIYSVGENTVDNGGVEKDHASDGPEDDIVFRVERRTT